MTDVEAYKTGSSDTDKTTGALTLIAALKLALKLDIAGHIYRYQLLLEIMRQGLGAEQRHCSQRFHERSIGLRCPAGRAQSQAQGHLLAILFTYRPPALTARRAFNQLHLGEQDIRALLALL